ncbi:MAG: AbrB/MazE/SpoVT family DNA-binding domain-containing protein [Deltaproteobacteria bacterium]|nr:AbrB/MazE/SpoVT family DNA-binding domain-containing protein [Deltaproteobacteria bacterium]
MHVKVQQWGNSLALRIPKTYAVDIKLHKGSVIDISESEGKLVVTPIEEPELTLKQLLAGITKENIHHEVDTWLPVGNEIW